MKIYVIKAYWHRGTYNEDGYICHTAYSTLEAAEEARKRLIAGEEADASFEIATVELNIGFTCGVCNEPIDLEGDRNL